MSIDEVIDGISNYGGNDGGANYAALHEGLAISQYLVSKVLGILVIAVLIGLPVVIIIEIAYLNLPIFNGYTHKIADKHAGFRKVFGLCLRDAQLAEYRHETDENYKSVNYYYLLIKIKTVLIVFICVGIVLGPMNIIIQYIVKLVSNAANALG